MASARQRKKQKTIAPKMQEKKKNKAEKAAAEKAKQQEALERGREYAQYREQVTEYNRTVNGITHRKKVLSKNAKTEKAKQRELAKFQTLLAVGYTEAEAKKHRRASYEKIEQLRQAKLRELRKERKKVVYTSKKYLTLLWVNFAQENNFLSGHAVIKMWDTWDKKQQARLMYENADPTKTGSGDATGDYREHVGSKLGGLELIEQYAESVELKNERIVQSGKGDFNRQYEIILTPTNRFTVDGMLNLMNNMMPKLMESRRAAFYTMLKDFTYDYLPKDFYDQVF